MAASPHLELAPIGQQPADRRQRASAGTYVPYGATGSAAPDAMSTSSLAFDYADDSGARVSAGQASPFFYSADPLGYPSAPRRDYSGGDLPAQWNASGLAVGSQASGIWQQGYGSHAIPSSYQSYDPVPVPVSAGWASSTAQTSAAGAPTIPYSQPDVLDDLVASSYFTGPGGGFPAAGGSTSDGSNWYASQQRQSLSPGRARAGTADSTTMAEYDYPDDLLSPSPARTSSSSARQTPGKHYWVSSSPSESRPGKDGRSARSSQAPDARHDNLHDDAFIIMQNGVEKRGYHPPDVWDSHKEIIRRLYLDERRPLKDVVQIMEDTYGFRATPKMYKTKFTTWGFAKNNTEKEAKQILYHKLMRDAQGKRSVFSRHGKQIDLQRYLRRKGVTEMDLVDFDADGTLPPHVRCWTPT
ncbi:hypothetical protein GQ53DRAFT_748703 [Thozetella sp. PMI_491]|nr:hypothetical protein GQ53DRAFT_748703 [Thozetella sp. PMI_491]